MSSSASPAARQILARNGGALSGVNSDITSLEGPAGSGVKIKAAVTGLTAAATVDIGNAPTRRVRIDGSSTITSFGTAPNAEVLLSFTNTSTIKFNPASLILPGYADIITADGDTAVATSTASGNWRVREYTRVTGKPLYGIGTQDANAVAITGGAINGTAIGATTPSTVNAVTYNMSGAKVLERAGQYTALFGPDGSQIFTGGSPTDGVRYFTGDEHLFRSKTFQPFLRANANGISVNGNMAFTVDAAFTLGMPALRAAVIYAASGTINTSDAREKTPVRPLTDQEIAAAKAMAREVGVFQWLVAIEDKGDAARLHVGMTVQRAIEIMEAHGLDAVRYGLICHDVWDAVPPKPAVEAREPEYDEDGVMTDPGELGRPGEPGREAGDRFGFRADQLLLFLARGFDARLSALEAGQA